MGGSKSKISRYFEEEDKIYYQVQRRRRIMPDHYTMSPFAVMDFQNFVKYYPDYGEPEYEEYWEDLYSITSPNYYRALAIDSIRDKEFQEALNHLKNASLQFDNNSTYMQALDEDEFRSTLNNNRVELYCKWGEELLKISNFTDALNKFDEALNCDPNNSKAQSLEAKTYATMGLRDFDSCEYAFAYKFYENATNLNSDYQQDMDKSHQCFQLNCDAELQLENENYTDAITKLSQLIALNPNDQSAKNKLDIAKSMKEGGALQRQAEQLLENALEYKKRNDLDNALKYYKMALEKFQEVEQIYAKSQFPTPSKLQERIQDIDENIQHIEILINENINVNINQEQLERSAEHSVHDELCHTRVI